MNVGLDETDIVTELELLLRAADLNSALRVCQRLAQELPTWRFRIGPCNPEHQDVYQAVFILREPADPGERTGEELRRVVAAHAEVLHIDNRYINLDEIDGQPLVRVLLMQEQDTAQIVPGCISCVLVAKQGLDPFSAEPEEAEVGSLEDVEDEVNFTEEELRDLGMLVCAVTTTQVLLVGVVTGRDEVDAHHLVRDLADRVRRAVLPDSAETMTGDPHRLDDGSIRVASLAGGTELLPQEAVDTVTALLSEFVWSPPERVKVRGDKDYFAAEARPEGAFARLEVHASPGLGWFPIEPG